MIASVENEIEIGFKPVKKKKVNLIEKDDLRQSMDNAEKAIKAANEVMFNVKKHY